MAWVGLNLTPRSRVPTAMLRFLILLMASLGGSLAPLAPAFAHGVIGGEDSGNEFFWIYGLVLTGLAGTLIYRKWWAVQETPERKAQKSRLRDFERDHALCMTQLQNAEDYPQECGLTEAERKDRLQSAASMQKNIDEIKSDLAAT